MSGRRIRHLAGLLGIIVALPSCGGTTTAPSSTPPAVTYSVTGTAKTVQLGYSDPCFTALDPIVIPSSMTLPFTYTCQTAPPTNTKLFLSAQIDTPGDQGSIRASISKNGVEVASQTATGFPNSATLSTGY